MVSKGAIAQSLTANVNAAKHLSWDSWKTGVVKVGTFVDLHQGVRGYVRIRTSAAIGSKALIAVPWEPSAGNSVALGKTQFSIVYLTSKTTKSNEPLIEGMSARPVPLSGGRSW